MATHVELVDYQNPQQADELLSLLSSYATDVMGGGEDLLPHVKENLILALSEHPGAFSLIAYVEGEAAGMANCFMGFSTFACAPLVNIHDFAVAPKYRGLQLSQLMLAKVEAIARERGCCKVTLEVLQGNTVAQNAYRKSGFAGYELDAEQGHALFWQKKLS